MADAIKVAIGDDVEGMLRTGAGFDELAKVIKVTSEMQEFLHFRIFVKDTQSTQLFIQHIDQLHPLLRNMRQRVVAGGKPADQAYAWPRGVGATGSIENDATVGIGRPYFVQKSMVGL